MNGHPRGKTAGNPALERVYEARGIPLKYEVYLRPALAAGRTSGGWMAVDPSPLGVWRVRVRAGPAGPRMGGVMFENLQDGLRSAIKSLRGKGKLTEANMRDGLALVEQSLLEADVSYAVVKDFTGWLTGSERGLALLTSSDGLEWSRARRPLFMRKEIVGREGLVTPVDRLERPQLLVSEDGMPEVLYAASSVVPCNDKQDGGTFNIQIALGAR